MKHGVGVKVETRIDVWHPSNRMRFDHEVHGTVRVWYLRKATELALMQHGFPSRNRSVKMRLNGIPVELIEVSTNGLAKFKVLKVK